MTLKIVETKLYMSSMFTYGLYLLTTRAVVRRQYCINQQRVENKIY